MTRTNTLARAVLIPVAALGLNVSESAYSDQCVLFGNVNLFAGEFGPDRLDVGDLDGDGHLDVAITHAHSIITIHLNNGHSVFHYASQVLVPAVTDVVIRDMDGDSDNDLAVSMGYADAQSVGLLLNNGDATFAPIQEHLVGSGSLAVAAEDLDFDGDVDLACARVSNNTLTILRNDGNGAFAHAGNYNTLSGPVRVIARRFDGDTDIDLAVFHQVSSIVTIRLNDGTGSFPTQALASSGASVDWAVGDVENDGDIDIASALAGSGVRLLLNNGSAGFSQHQFSGDFSQAIGLADIDGDGDQEIITGAPGPHGLSIRWNLGGNTFGPVVGHSVSATHSMLWRDVDRDGDADMLATSPSSYGYTLLLTSNGQPGVHQEIPYPSGGRLIDAGDAEGDGDADLFVTHDNGQLSVVRNEGGGDFTSLPPSAQPLMTSSGQRIRVADLDDDGDADFAGVVSNAVVVARSNGDGTFQPATAYPIGQLPRSLAVGDWTGDGLPDLVAVNYLDGTLSVLTNLGAAAFAISAPAPLAAFPNDVAMAHLDDDPHIDIAVTHRQHAITLLFGNGNGGIRSTAVLTTFPNPALALEVADFDGDGDTDLATGMKEPGSNEGRGVRIWLNNGAGAMTNIGVFGGLNGDEYYALRAGDLNGDGFPDLAAVYLDQSGKAVLMNQGNGTFEPEVFHSSGNRQSVAVAELTGDGRIDLASISSEGSQGAVRIARNLGPQINIVDQPDSIVAPSGSSASFSIKVMTGETVQYQWRKDDVPLRNGAGVSGVDTPTLNIAEVSQDHTGTYDVVLATVCGSMVSQAATLVVTDVCPADIAPSGGNGMVDVNDLLLVIGNWGATGPNPADVNGDMVVDVNDLLAVVGTWGPCP